MKVKICGMTCADDILCVNKNHVDLAGFVMFFPKSKRNLPPEAAVELKQQLAPWVKSVAVVVSPTVEQLAVIEASGFDYVQVHGQLSEAVLAAAQLPILRAFNVSNLAEFDRWRHRDNIAGFVFDAAEPGSGKIFDWSLVQGIHCPPDKLLLLAGGLHPGNVAEAVRWLHPNGVDVSSGVERDEGNGKDPEKVRAFVQQARMAAGESNDA